MGIYPIPQSTVRLGGSRGGLRVSGGAQEINALCPAITPTIGSTLLTNGNMETTAGWVQGTTVLTYETDERTGGAGSKCAQIVRDAGGATDYMYQATLPVVVNIWYRLSAWVKNIDAAGGMPRATNVVVSSDFYAGTTWAEYIFTGRATATPSICRLTYSAPSAGQGVRFDDAALAPLTFSTMRALLGSRSQTDGIYTCAPTVAYGTQAGMLIRYADDDNFVMAIISRINTQAIATLFKRIGGTYTSVISGNITYSAGQELEVQISGTDYSLYYNGSQVGTTQAIADGGLGNQIHGFNTEAGNSVGQVTTSPL